MTDALTRRGLSRFSRPAAAETHDPPETPRKWDCPPCPAMNL